MAQPSIWMCIVVVAIHTKGLHSSAFSFVYGLVTYKQYMARHYMYPEAQPRVLCNIAECSPTVVANSFRPLASFPGSPSSVRNNYNTHDLSLQRKVLVYNKRK